ncbi:TBC1 domain family member 20 isoform X1 [Leptopilina heterotoma]|uniref:TBC1 domain family member 20 isoform X1 n=1 Tax=Leptopilina heterotoma TaxID=63436 RepID=UPI001CA8E284|nr:TBC1 domain family member 20 isoform X1 [Leptopilina heterotoma]
MDKEEDEYSVIDSKADENSRLFLNNCLLDKHSSKVRRRNVIDKNNSSLTENNDFNCNKNIELSLDGEKAWIHDIPKLPEISNTPELFTERERMKIKVIQGTIIESNLTYGKLKLLSISSEGLVIDDVRRVLWPELLRLPDKEMPIVTELGTIHKCIPCEVYQQVLKDVARSGGHLFSNTTEEEIQIFQEEMTQLICWVLYRNPHLHYYQGYNDVAATILLTMGLQKGLHVLEKISLTYLERFMEKTMEKVNQELFFIFALLEREHPKLLEHLENVELFPHFALAEYTTWYAHKYAENRKLLHRLFDYFLGSPPFMPLYLSTIIVIHRADEIFNTIPDMGHTHKILCSLPDDLPIENLLVNAKNLYHRHPPGSINNDVKDYDLKRRRKEQEWKTKVEAARLERENKLKIVQPRRRIPYRMRSYKTITVVTIIAIGLYAFLKSSTGLN